MIKKQKTKYAKIGQQVEVQVPGPEDAIFLNPALKGEGITPVMIEKHDLYTFDKVEYPSTGGILLYLKGLKYPIKGFPEPAAVLANNYVKRIFISQMRLFSKYPLSAYYLLTKKGRNVWCREFIDTTYPIIEPYLLQPIKYNNLSRELYIMTPTFLVNIGISADLAQVMAHLVAAMIEHDDAYRYRAEDLFSCTSKEDMLKNPAKEMALMIKILGQRDNRKHLVEKFNAIRRLLTIGFLYPGVKKAFLKAISLADFKQMGLDEMDTYHTLRYSTYDFKGRSFKDRYSEYLNIHHGKLPESIPINQS